MPPLTSTINSENAKLQIVLDDGNGLVLEVRNFQLGLSSEVIESRSMDGDMIPVRVGPSHVSINGTVLSGEVSFGAEEEHGKPRLQALAKAVRVIRFPRRSE